MPYTPAEEKHYTVEELESRYQDITVIYDYAGELIETVESRFVRDQQAQWSIVEPLVHELGEATDVLAEEFIHIAEGAKKKTLNGKMNKTRIEASLRRIYTAVHEYRIRVRDLTKQAYDAIENIADPIVDKIQRHVEKLVVMLLDFVQLSLTNMMGKAELDQLKQRETRVAFMLHQMAQQQG